MITSLRAGELRGRAAAPRSARACSPSAQLPVELGRRTPRRAARRAPRSGRARATGSRAGARRRRGRRRSRTSARLKKMWPLISPASGAPVSFIFALISEWPVFHSSGLPPWLPDPRREVARGLDVVDDLAPGLRAEHVGGEQHQLPVGVDDAAVLGDDAEPVAVAVEREAELGVGRVRASGSGPAGSRAATDRDGGSGNVPSTSQKSSITSQPSRR